MKRFEIPEHIGLHCRRLLINDATGRRENAFIDEWNKLNTFSSISSSGLTALLGRGPTQEEATLAATIIQWLGTNCGQCLIRDAMGAAEKANEAESRSAK